MHPSDRILKIIAQDKLNWENLKTAKQLWVINEQLFQELQDQRYEYVKSELEKVLILTNTEKEQKYVDIANNRLATTTTSLF